MNYKKAHKIINSNYNTSNNTDDWYIIKEDDKLFLTSYKEGIKEPLTNNKFVSYYLFDFIISSEGFIEGDLRLTSMGLVSEEEYQTAIDMTSSSLEQYQLRNQYIYSGTNGKEYIYIDNLEIILLYFNKDIDVLFRETKNISFLVEIRKNKLNVIKYRKDVKLVSEVGRYEDEEKVKNKILNGKDYYPKYIHKVLVVKAIGNNIDIICPVNGQKFRSFMPHTKVAINNSSRGKECYVKVEVEGNLEDSETVSSFDYVNYGFYAKKVNNFKFLRGIKELIDGKIVNLELEDTFKEKYYYIGDDPVPF